MTGSWWMLNDLCYRHHYFIFNVIYTLHFQPVSASVEFDWEAAGQQAPCLSPAFLQREISRAAFLSLCVSVISCYVISYPKA